MSLEYGVKINNYKANKLYDYSNGIKTYFTDYDYKRSVMPNSLFLDFLLNNGLKVSKSGFTRDIINIDFIDSNKPLNVQGYEKRINNINNKDMDEDIKAKMIEDIEQVKHKLEDINIKDLRKKMYKDGVVIPYRKTINKGKPNERVIIDETIEYKMLYRSTGKAKKGSVVFINKKLYKKAINFLRMGIKLPKDNAKIVEISAYSSLVASSIVDKILIEPENILVLKDVDSFFKTKVVNIGVNENNECITNIIDNYELKNSMFDGQSLIDSSIFPRNAEGYILLRQHFFKSASFCCHIQKFFKDYYKDKYDNAQIEDMWGNKHYVKDIKLITTDNSIKWLKFKEITYEYWCEKVRQNGCMFGVVKTAHKSKLGDVQKMSYQMVNCLDINSMDEVVKESLQYIKMLKDDNDVFLNYLSRNDNFSNDYDVLCALAKQDSDFIYSEYFKNRRKYIIEAYVKNFKTGKIIQNADNLVFVGSPYAMLLHSVGESVESDKTLIHEEGAIQCYTERFEDGEYLAGFRSPHNSQNNILALHNVYSKELKEYFELGEQIIALNVNHTDVQDRANGCDFDSDSGYITNQPQIVQHALYCYKNYPTIVNNIPLLNMSSYGSSMEDFAEVDNKLADAQKGIGRSSNLAQIALTYGYNFSDEKYKMYACILSVIAQVCIDSAKRVFVIDTIKEIDRIEKDMHIVTREDGEIVADNGYPIFWKAIKKLTKEQEKKFDKKINEQLICPMNFLSNIKIPKAKFQKTIPMGVFFNKVDFVGTSNRKSVKVENFIEKYSIDLMRYNTSDVNDDNEYLLLISNFNDMIEELKGMYIGQNYKGLFGWLIDRTFCITNRLKGKKKIHNMNNLDKNKPLLLKVLYKINPKILLECFNKNITKDIDK